jgi:Fe2+ transport system protein FeoA
MSSVRLAFSSEHAGSDRTHPARVGQPLSALDEGDRGVVVEVREHVEGRADRLLALGVTPGASVTVLQTFPGIVLMCDQTELAIEWSVAEAIVVRRQEGRS